MTAPMQPQAEQQDTKEEKEKEWAQKPVDAKAYYGYLFEADKKPTKMLDVLLRGIAGYISEHIGDKEQKHLTPDKLAAFYKAVGGNYDSLFVSLPPPSISWIYASIGCQHLLLPVPMNDFVPPSIPALTTRGFVRWQSIEILLGPEEHVPFIQSSLQNFDIRNPDTGEPFPIDLPASAFPEHADPEIERWHEQCANMLRRRATPSEDEAPRPRAQKATTGFSHVHARPRTEYFQSQRSGRPPVSYQHVSSQPTAKPSRPGLSRSPSHRARQFLAPEDNSPKDRGRRRSFPSPGPDGERPPEGRRHSHSHGPPGTRHMRRGSRSSDASSEDEDVSPKSHTHPRPKTDSRSKERERERDRADMPPPGVRYAVPPTPGTTRPGRDRDRTTDDEQKRRSFPIPIDITGKLSMPFMLGRRDSHRNSHRERDREREMNRERASRSDSRGNGNGTGTGNGNSNIRWRDLDPELLRRESEDDRPGSGRDRERDKVRRDGGSGRVSYEERDRRNVEKEYPNLHPNPISSSGRDSADGRAFRDRDRDRRYVSGSGGSGRDSGGNNGVGSGREGSPIRGVDGRRYPSGHA